MNGSDVLGSEDFQTLQSWSLLSPSRGVGVRYIEAHVPGFDGFRHRLLIKTLVFSPTFHFHTIPVLLLRNWNLTWDPLDKSPPFLFTSVYNLTFHILPRQILLFWPVLVFQNFCENSHPLITPLLFFSSLWIYMLFRLLLSC